MPKCCRKPKVKDWQKKLLAAMIDYARRNTLKVTPLCPYEGTGGKNMGPSPIEYLCMSLASCKAITLRMYIQRKLWKVDTITVKVSLVRKNMEVSDTFYCDITVTGTLDEYQQKTLIEIAKVCPISRILSKQNEVITRIENLKTLSA